MVAGIYILIYSYFFKFVIFVPKMVKDKPENKPKISSLTKDGIVKLGN